MVSRRDRDLNAETDPNEKFCADFEAHHFSVAGAEVDLTRQQAAILRLLLQRAGSVITRSELAQTVLGEFSSPAAIDQAIRSLRRQLGRPRWVKTLRGIGHRWEGPVPVQIVSRFSQSIDTSPAIEYDIRKEYAELTPNRGVMWGPLNEAYGRFRKGTPDTPAALAELLHASGMPPDVGARNGRDLIDWPSEHAAELQGLQKTLWQFVTLVYPPRDGRSGDVTDHTFIDKKDASSFHRARGALAHFWNRAGKRLPVSFFAENYQSAFNDLIVLSWFDVALKQWTHDPDEGKVHLFRIAHAVVRARLLIPSNELQQTR